jgi:hypothetical protein
MLTKQGDTFMTNLINSAMTAYDNQKFDREKVLLAMAVRFPQEFLQEVEDNPCEVEGRVLSLNPCHHEEMLDLLQTPLGGVIRAVKYVRSVTGSGLKDAKNYVDMFRPGTPCEWKPGN